jgi:hypothetical protein
MDGIDRESWIAIAGRTGNPQAITLLAEEASMDNDPLLRLAIAEQLVDAGDPRGLDLIVELLEDSVPLLVRDESYQVLTARADRDFGYDSFGEPEANAVALAEIYAWVETQKRGSE